MMPNKDRVYLREWRLAKGLTQPELAKRIGTVKSEISRLEKGSRRMTLDWMSRAAKAMGVSVEDLMTLPPMGFGSVSPAPEEQGARAGEMEVTQFGSATIGVSLVSHGIATISGDDWSGHFQPGDLVIFDKTKRSTAVPGIFVLEIEGDRMTRRVMPTAGGMILTCPNPEYPSAPLTEDHKVLGRVVGRVSRL